MSESLIELMNDLHQMQALLDVLIKCFAAMTRDTVDQKLRLSENEARQVAEYTHDMVDQMIKRVEDAFRVELRKSK